MCPLLMCMACFWPVKPVLRERGVSLSVAKHPCWSPVSVQSTGHRVLSTVCACRYSTPAG